MLRLAWVVGLCAGISAFAVTWTVDDDGPADYSSIQAAINDAANGDDILVKPGAYRETINFLGKSITVESEAGPASTTIFLEGETRIVRLNGDATLRGFTITGGRARVGGGIYVTDGALATIEGNIIENNSAEWNGVLPGFGGGIAIDLASEPVITRNVIRDNQAVGDATGAYGYGGGIDIGDYTNATITNNVIYNNQATDSGGGIAVGVIDGPTLITNNAIVDNRAGLDGGSATSLGGGIVIDTDFTGDIVNNVFQGNLADSDGGGIYFFTGGLQGIDYENNDFDANAPNDCVGLPGNKCSDAQLFVAPLFTNAPLEFRLRSDSGLIDAGSTTGIPVTDADGRPRNVDGDLDGSAAPDVGPFENQGELTRLRFDSATALSWDGSVNGAVVYDLYRDPLSSLAPGPLGTCSQAGLPTPSANDATTPAAGAGFFYLVGGRDVGTASLGFDSNGAARNPLSACP